MVKRMIVFGLLGLLPVLWGCGGRRHVAKPSGGKGPSVERAGGATDFVRERTFIYGESEIIAVFIKVADVLDVIPYIRKRRLRLRVVLKNAGSRTQSFRVYGQGRKENRDWVGGESTVRLRRGEEKAVDITTRFKTRTVPKQIRVEVF
jgi:hypothetical protein